MNNKYMDWALAESMTQGMVILGYDHNEAKRRVRESFEAVRRGEKQLPFLNIQVGHTKER